MLRQVLAWTRLRGRYPGRPRPTRLSRLTKIRRRRLGTWVLLALFCACILIVLSLPRPETVTVIKGRTEQISFRVLRPDFARFRADGFRPMRELDGKVDWGECLAGIVAPPQGALVTYRRLGKSAVFVSSDPPFRLIPEGGNGVTASTRTLKAVERDCQTGETPIARLPIWGPGILGERLRVISDDDESQPGLVIEAEVRVYGRSVELLPGWLRRLVGLNDRLKPNIYLGGSLPLPVGGQVDGMRGPPQEKSEWWGMARLDAKEEGALVFEISTESTSLLLLEPGAVKQGQTISVGKLAQLSSDPNMISLQIFFAILLYFGDRFLTRWLDGEIVEK